MHVGKQDFGFKTKFVWAGRIPDRYRSLIQPLYLSAVYLYTPGDIVYVEGRPLKYGREENPTVRYAEKRLAAVENAVDAMLFSSGMAAMATMLVAARSIGFTRLIAPLDLYSASLRLVRSLGQLLGFQVVVVEPGSENLLLNIRKGSLVVVESISNTLLRVYDVASLAREASMTDSMLVIDNTIATPYNLSPGRYGVALTLYSATKHLSGHNDVVAGAVVDHRGVFIDKLWEWRRTLGTIAAPLEAYLVERGLKTLAIRMEYHNRVAHTVAERLRDEGFNVTYPCLEEHPDYAIARRLLRGCSSLLLIDLGSRDAAKRFLENLRVVKPGTSFGGAESLAVHMVTGPASSLDADTRRRIGLGDGVVRIHVGLEDPEDVVEDIVSAAEKAGVRRGG